MPKHREYVGSHTRVIEELAVDGYVVKPEHLQRLDSTIKTCELFGDQDPNDVHCPIRYHAFIEDGSIRQFQSLDDLIDYPNTSPEIIEGLRVGRCTDDDRKVEVELSTFGEIIIDVCGPPNVVETIVHTLSRQLRALDQKYSWLVNRFVLGGRPRRLSIFLLVQVVLLLMFSIAYYVYGLKVGVDVDPNVLPGGTAYAQRIEAAIQSDDLSEKLNVLLMGNLRGFINVSDFFQITRAIIVACLLAILILGAAVWISRHLRRYYPQSFFATGHQQEVLTRIEKKRDLWVTGIIIGFIVNIIAGILIAILGG